MERRVNPRWSLNSSNLVISNISKESQHSGLVTDISASGMGILTTATFSAGENIVLSAQLSSSKPPLKTKATVRWAQALDQNTKYGLEFAGINTDIVRDYIQGINISNIESFIGYSLPGCIKANYIDDWIFKTYDEREIPQIIDFEKPFLKIDKVIVFDSFKDGSLFRKKGLSVGKLYESDIRGHYNNTIFLAICGQLMGQAGSIFLAALNPQTAPQVVEVDRIEPILSDEYLWQPREEGSLFFIETEIIKNKRHLFIVNVKVFFGEILLGVVEGLKLILTPKDSIMAAKKLPLWK